ncbi:MAG: NmrA/HSCARG family protein, partial [Longimicrobiales bacterium]
MTSSTILVTGATGNVGGAVTRALQAEGRRIRALVREAGGPSAAELATGGVEVVQGDLGDVASLTAAARGADAVFLVTTPAAGTDVEVIHGTNMIAAAEAAGASRLVFSSVASADQQTGIPHFDSKAEIEEALSRSSLAWTVTAPAFFYDNVDFPWNQADLAEGRFRQALPRDRALQQISVDDVGRFNALVLDVNGTLDGQRIEIAADELTGSEMAHALSHALGRPIHYEPQSLDEVRNQFADMAVMYEWLDRVGFEMDIEGLRRRFPQIPWT